MERTDSSPRGPAGRQSFYIAPDTMAQVARYGKEQGIVNTKGEAILSKTVETILERFLSLEYGGQHVTALLDAHTSPVEEKLDVLTVMVRGIAALLPPQWPFDEEQGWALEEAARRRVQEGRSLETGQ